MTDEEWERRSNRAIRATFQMGRPVFADTDTDGEPRYTDGDKEQVPVDVSVDKHPPQRAVSLTVWAERATRLTFFLSSGAAIGAAIGTLWNPWQIVSTVMFTASAVLWRRINRDQRALLGRGR